NPAWPAPHVVWVQRVRHQGRAVRDRGLPRRRPHAGAVGPRLDPRLPHAGERGVRGAGAGSRPQVATSTAPSVHAPPEPSPARTPAAPPAWRLCHGCNYVGRVTRNRIGPRSRRDRAALLALTGPLLMAVVACTAPTAPQPTAAPTTPPAAPSTPPAELPVPELKTYPVPAGAHPHDV